MDLSTILARRADFTPDKPAIVFEEQSVSYATFCTRIAQTAGALASLGVTAGDRVAVLAQNHPAILELLFACARLGAILVPLNWRLAVPEHQYILGNCTPKILAADQVHRNHLTQAAASHSATFLALEGEADEQVEKLQTICQQCDSGISYWDTRTASGSYVYLWHHRST